MSPRSAKALVMALLGLLLNSLALRDDEMPLDVTKRDNDRLVHDIRSLIAPLQLELEARSHECPSPRERTDQRLQIALDRILTYCEVELAHTRGQPAPFDFRPVRLEEVFREVITQVKGETAKIAFSVDGGGVFVPRSLAVDIHRIVFNLANNAVHAMRNHRGTSLSLSAGLKNAFLFVDVIDNGPGLPDDVRDRLLPGATRGDRGNGRVGLGISSAVMLAKRNCGELHLLSSSRAGTEFRLLLPFKVSSDDWVPTR